jgi:hypothetical protein
VCTCTNFRKGMVVIRARLRSEVVISRFAF